MGPAAPISQEQDRQRQQGQEQLRMPRKGPRQYRQENSGTGPLGVLMWWSVGSTPGPPWRWCHNGATAGAERPAGARQKELKARSGSRLSLFQREETGAAELEARESQPRPRPRREAGGDGDPWRGAPLIIGQGRTRPPKPSSSCPTRDDKWKDWSSPGAADLAVCAQQPQPPESGHSPAGGC